MESRTTLPALYDLFIVILHPNLLLMISTPLLFRIPQFLQEVDVDKAVVHLLFNQP